MGKTHGDSITFNCDNCDKEKTIGLSNYTSRKNHFCSKSCADDFKKTTYKCPEGYSRCNICNEIKSINEFMIQKRPNGTDSYLTCKVCSYLKRNNPLIIDNWGIEEYKIILDNLLNSKVEYVNDIQLLLNNKSLKSIALLLNSTLKIAGRTKIRFKEYCTYCGEEFNIKLYQFLDNQLHFCSGKCNTKYYGEIKSSKRQFFDCICQNKECNKHFLVNVSRMNAGRNKFCCSECSQLSQINKIIVSCSYCGKEVETNPYRYNTQNHIFCNNECSRKYFVGENSNTWDGGITNLNMYLRNQLTSWKEDTKKYSNNKCVITGEDYNDIHHIYPFNKIVSETLFISGLPLKIQIGDYTQDELILLKIVCQKLHYKYGLGVCLKEEIHYLYHYLYGDDNTFEQFEEFKIRFRLGEFNEYLNSNINLIS